MNTIEDKVRHALRETGEEIGPHGVPPLRLPGTRRARLPRIPGRWDSWLTPLAAAAAVAAVVATSLAISAAFHGQHQGTGTGTTYTGNGPVAHRAPAGPPAALRLVPRYFVELTAAVQARTAVVRSTITGHVLATVAPPRPYNVFTWVSGAAGDHTFILAAQRYWNIASGQAGMPAEDRDNTTPTVFFRLTFDPRTGAAQLTRLTIPGTVHSSDLAGMAVSPDGTRLALDFRQSVKVVTLATRAARTWTWPGGGWIGNTKPLGQIFSWTSGGRYLAFQQWDGGSAHTAHILLLDTTAPGTSLAAARVILTFGEGPTGISVTGNTFLTPDGSRLVAPTDFSHLQITEFSVRTGQPVLAEDRFSSTVGWQDVLWAGPRGRALVVADPRGQRTRYGRRTLMGVLSGNKFTPVPHGAARTAQIAW